VHSQTVIGNKYNTINLTTKIITNFFYFLFRTFGENNIMRIQITKNFYLDEFECTDKSDIPLEVFNNILDLAEQMQKIRDVLGVSITVNSGYRSPDYNKSVGGASKSQHLLGCACDFTAKGLTPYKVAEQLEDLMQGGTIINGGLGEYDTFTHYDIRNNPARWNNCK